MLAQDPFAQDLSHRLLPPVWVDGGDPTHLLGTDYLGRDTVARLAHGARLTFVIAGLAVLAGGTVGTITGLIAGYFKGWTEAFIMRLSEVQLAFPTILLAILVIGALGPSIPNLILVLSAVSWVFYARVVRSQVLTIRELQFVDAAKTIGSGPARIVLGHVLPNVGASIIVIATVTTGQVIIAEASLSFLGLGVQPPDPSWGRMLSDSRDYLAEQPWLAIVPCVAIVGTVLGINLLGDWLRDALDPSLRV